jgi:hypothetical protein
MLFAAFSGENRRDDAASIQMLQRTLTHNGKCCAMPAPLSGAFSDPMRFLESGDG